MPRARRQAFHDDFSRALVFAARLHAQQVRKETDIPYLSHLIGVASIVMDHGGDRDAAIAALLHDSIEDQAQDYPGGAQQLRADIRDQFGDAVLAIVEQCTDSDSVPKPPWKTRKLAYIAHLPDASDAARLVTCADKLHNARSILSDLHVVGDALWNRFSGRKAGSLWYYRELANVLQRLGPQPLASELDRTVREIERLAG